MKVKVLIEQVSKYKSLPIHVSPIYLQKHAPYKWIFAYKMAKNNEKMSSSDIGLKMGESNVQINAQHMSSILYRLERGNFHRITIITDNLKFNRIIRNKKFWTI